MGRAFKELGFCFKKTGSVRGYIVVRYTAEEMRIIAGVRYSINVRYAVNTAMAAAMAQKGAQAAFLSISHDGDTAMAAAVLEG